MPRRVQDIIPSGRRSIQDPQLAGSRRPDDATGRKVSLHRLPLTPPPPVIPKKPRAKRNKFILPAILIVIVVAIAGWAASAYFSRATFVIAARTLPISVNATVVASGTSSPGYLAYQVMSESGSASTTVAASDGPAISTKASGSVTIYNSYSSQPQRLVAGTRLADDSGLIYRLTGSVVVPGYTGSSGSIKPGMLATAVVADQPGQQYDISEASAPSDFRIVAYQGTPKYAGFSARLASDITGGFDGDKKTVDPGVLASTSAILDAQLTARLLASAVSAVPSGSIMYDDAYVTDLSAPIVGGGSADSAVISEQGTLYAILFVRADLIAKLAGQPDVSSFGSFPYTAPGLDSLSFAITNAGDFSPQAHSVLIAHFNGSMKLIGTVPEAELRQKLAGLPLAETESILQTYSPVIDIGKSSGELSPPWVSRVPADESRISIKVVNGS